MSREGLRLRVARALAVCVLCLSSRALAAEPLAQTPGRARQLFDEGRALMKDHQYPEACGKFEESLELDPGGGTLLNLALCYELSGKTATAWGTFQRALESALRDGRPDRQKFAEQHIAALEPRLSRLRVVAQQEHVAGLRILRNGVEIGQLAWREGLPLDPGEHVLVISAPGKVPLRIRISSRPNGEVQTVVIPALEQESPGVAEPSPARAPELLAASQLRSPPRVGPQRLQAPHSEARGQGDVQRLAGVIASGAGLASVAIGAFFGIRAIHRKSAADARCPSVERCDPSAFSLSEQAIRDGDVSTVLVASGAAVAVTGGLLLLYAPSGQGQQGFGASLSGRF